MIFQDSFFFIDVDTVCKRGEREREREREMNRCIRRIHADIREIRHSETAHYTASPSEEDMRKWYVYFF